MTKRRSKSQEPVQAPADSIVLKKKDYDLLKRQLKNFRSFSSVEQSNLTGNWLKGDKYTHRDISKSQAALVKLSRNFEKEESLYKKYLQLVEINVGGEKGFNLTVKAKNKKRKLAIDVNDCVEKAWKKWCKSDYCDVTGRNNFAELCTIIAKTGERDGEYLIRHIRDVATKENPFGYQIQILDPQLIDETKGKHAPVVIDGKHVYMGVELNEYMKMTGLYLKTSAGENTLNVLTSNNNSFEYVSREDVIHDFINLYPQQVRGIPPGHSVFNNLKHLNEFIQAILMAIKIAACSSIFLESTDPTKTNTTEENADLIELDENDEVVSFAKKISPGSINALPPGYKMSSFTSQFPDAASAPFIMFMTKLIAVGLGVSAFTLTSSLEQVNYTSSRTGLLEDRSTWKKKQSVLISKVINKIFENWLHRSILNGALVTSTGRVLNLDDYEDVVSSYEFQGRRWDWVDPMKDTATNVLLIQNKLATRTSVLRELGIDYEDILAQIQEEIELEKLYLGEEIATASTEEEKSRVKRIADIFDNVIREALVDKDALIEKTGA